MKQITPHIAAELVQQVNEIALYLDTIIEMAEYRSTEYNLAEYALDHCDRLRQIITNQK